VLCASVVPQFVLGSFAKFVGFVPPIVMLAIFSVALPVLLNVSGFNALVVPSGWLPNATEEVSETTGAAAIPVPVRGTVCGDPLASSLKLSAAV